MNKTLKGLILSLFVATIFYGFSTIIYGQEEYQKLPIYNMSGGLNNESSSLTLADNESPDCQNVEFDRKNCLTRIKGFVLDNTTYYYSVGTASASAKTVYGVDTVWSTNASTGSVIEFADEGTFYFIRSVDSDTRLTLEDTYAGSASSTGTYKICDIAENLYNYTKADGSEYLIWCGNGRVMYTTGESWTLLISTLNVNYQIRGITHSDKFWFGNSNNPNYYWDATTLYECPYSTCPQLGQYWASSDGRLWISGKVDNENLLYYSEIGTVDADSTSWPAANYLEIDAGDGDVIKGLYSCPYGEAVLIVFKENSTYLVYPAQVYGQYVVAGTEYIFKKISDRYGCLYQESIKETQKGIVWLSRDGFVRWNGQSITPVSDKVDTDIINQTKIYFKSWLQSSQSDFTAGTCVNVDTWSVSGNVTLDPCDTASDWNEGACVNISTTDFLGNAQLESSFGQIQTDDYCLNKTATGSNTDYGVSYPSHVCDGNFTSFWSISLVDASSEDYYIQVDMGSNYEIASSSFVNFGHITSGGIGNIWLQTSVNGTDWTTIKIYTNVAVGYNNYEHTFSPTQTFRYIRIYFYDYTSSGCPGNVGTLSAKEITAFGQISTGTYTSKIYDYGVVLGSASWFNYGNFSSSATTNGQTLAYMVRSDTNTAMASPTTWANITNNSSIDAVLTTQEQYMQWKASFTTTNSTTTPVIHQVYVGGYLKGQTHNFGTDITVWDLYERDESELTGTSIDDWVKFSTNSAMLYYDTFTAVNDGDMINYSTNNYHGQWICYLNTTDPTQSPTLKAVTINWREGIAPFTPVTADYFDEEYTCYFSTGDCRYNNYGFKLDKNNAWWPVVGKNFGAIVEYKDRQYASSSNSDESYIDQEGFNFNGSSYDSYWKTKDYCNIGDLNLRYKYKDLFYIWYSGRRNYDVTTTTYTTVNIGYDIENTGSYTDKTLYFSGDNYYADRFEIGKGKRGNILSFRFRVNEANTDMEFFGIDVLFSPRELKAH